MHLRIASRIILALLFILSAATVFGQDVKRKSLDKDGQERFLAQRKMSGEIVGTFDSFCSLLFAVNDVAIHTESNEINETKLQSVFPDFYKPTWKEVFNAIALQTRSTWRYDDKRDFWVFAAPALQKPYSITLPDKWQPKDMGMWNGYKPPHYPVGMDVYYFGTYSADSGQSPAALWNKVRNFWAVNFASKLKKGVTVEEMQKVTVDGAEALYFEAPAPRPNLLWRQWVFVIEGKTFFILSTLPKDDKPAMTDVDGMIKSFRTIR